MPPCTRGIPAVVTVHDLTHLHYYSRWHASYYEAVLKPLYKRCAAVVCVSEFTRSEFLQWSAIDSSRVHVVHNGVDREAFVEAQPLLLDAPYVLYPGNRRAYKNLYRLIEAYSLSALPRERILLVLTGEVESDLLAHAERLGVQGSIRFLGTLGERQIKEAYRGAMAVVFVSLYEGFGLPILEGMAASVPVLTSGCGAMSEVAAGAALLVDPHSVAAIADGIDRVIFDSGLRERLIVAGNARAMSETWDLAASRVWSIVEGAGRSLP